MSNLLYVTNEILQKLKQHKAYYFWFPIIQNFPIRNIPLEERSFHPRNIDVANGYIYLTVDMKFVYARDNMFSFLYENQDLSYRFTAYQGILRTLDNKQFTALIGKIAKITASTDVELVNIEKSYHPLFDSGAFVAGIPSEVIDLEVAEEGPKKKAKESAKERNTKHADEKYDKKKRGRPKKTSEAADITGEEEIIRSSKVRRGRPKKESVKVASTEKVEKNEELFLGSYPRTLCEEVYIAKMKMRKNYDFLTKKFGIDKQDLRKIIKLFRARENE